MKIILSVFFIFTFFSEIQGQDVYKLLSNNDESKIDYSLFLRKNVPVNFCLKDAKKDAKLVLIYNNYPDRKHGFILMRKVG